MDDDITTNVGRRVLQALLQLPGFTPDGGDIVSASGDRLRPFSDEDGVDHGTIELKRPGAGWVPFPAHHYLQQAIEREAGANEDTATGLLADMREDFGI